MSKISDLYEFWLPESGKNEVINVTRDLTQNIDKLTAAEINLKNNIGKRSNYSATSRTLNNTNTFQDITTGASRDAYDEPFKQFYRIEGSFVAKATAAAPTKLDIRLTTGASSTAESYVYFGNRFSQFIKFTPSTVTTHSITGTDLPVVTADTPLEFVFILPVVQGSTDSYTLALGMTAPSGTWVMSLEEGHHGGRYPQAL